MFDWRRTPRHGLVVVLHDSAEGAADVIDKLLRAHRFHAVDLFTSQVERYKAHFGFPCAPFAGAEAALADVLRRQLLADGSAPVEPVLAPEARDALAGFDAASQQRLLRHAEPIHWLPRRVFGASMPDDLYALLNDFLIIPDAALVFHHCLPDTRDDSWAKRKAFRRALAEPTPRHRLTRILSLPTTDAPLPPAYWQAASLVLLFPTRELLAPGNKLLASLFRNLNLTGMMRDLAQLRALLRALLDSAPRHCLVLDVRRDHLSSLAWTDYDSSRVMHATDIVHRKGDVAVPF